MQFACSEMVHQGLQTIFQISERLIILCDPARTGCFRKKKIWDEKYRSRGENGEIYECEAWMPLTRYLHVFSFRGV